MKMTQKKANKIKGLFAMLNGIEKERADSASSFEDRYNGKRFTEFDCDINDRVYWSCDLTSTDRVIDFNGNGSSYGGLAFGGHKPTMITIYDDSCAYSEFDSVVRFVRAALKNNGLRGMKFQAMEVVSRVTDYLDFELKEGD